MMMPNLGSIGSLWMLLSTIFTGVAAISDTIRLSNHLTRTRYLALSDSIKCGRKQAPGEFCGAVLNTVYDLADSTNFTLSDAFAISANRTASYKVKEFVVKYKTQTRNGTVIDATGIVWLPKGQAVSGGHPVLLYGHGTIGANDASAPSATLMSPDYYVGLEMNIMRNYAAFGFVVVIPDYAGFGVSGIPGYYLVKKPTAYSMIDGVRSALIFGERQGLTVSRDTVLLGHSQGGAAVLHTLELYDGPEAYGKSSFDVKAVVSSSPAPVWRYALFAAGVSYDQFLASVFSLYVYSASKYNTNLAMRDLLTSDAISTINMYAEAAPILYMYASNIFPANASGFFSPTMLSAIQYNLNGFLCYTSSPYCQGKLPPLDLQDMTLEPIPTGWQAQFDEDSPGLALRTSVPIRLIQGSVDTVVSPYFTIMLTHKLVTNGVGLVDKDGHALSLNNYESLVSELMKVTDCSSNGSILLCGREHSATIAALDQYVGYIFSKVNLPTTTNCVDDSSFYFNNNTKRTCLWIGEKPNRKKTKCSKMKKHKGVLVPVSTICPSACGVCS